MDYQICEKCEKNKPLSEFQRHRQTYKKASNSEKEWYYYPTCKECNKGKKSEQDRKWREAHKEEKAILDKNYREANKDTISQKRKEFYLANQERIREKVSKYREDKMTNDPAFVEKERLRVIEKAKRSKPARNKQRQARRKVDPNYKLRCVISKSVWGALKKNGGSKAGVSFLERFSYSMDDLRSHLEKQFEPWMNWSNHGHYNDKTWDDNDPATWTWQIDHIIPHSRFPYTSMEDQAFKDCWALSNLRPYSAKQNVIDGDR